MCCVYEVRSIVHVYEVYVCISQKSMCAKCVGCEMCCVYEVYACEMCWIAGEWYAGEWGSGMPYHSPAIHKASRGIVWRTAVRGVYVQTEHTATYKHTHTRLTRCYARHTTHPQHTPTNIRTREHSHHTAAHHTHATYHDIPLRTHSSRTVPQHTTDTVLWCVNVRTPLTQHTTTHRSQHVTQTTDRNATTQPNDAPHNTPLSRKPHIFLDAHIHVY